MEQAFGVPMFISHDTSGHHVPRGSINDGVGFSFNVIAIETILNSLTLPGQIKVAVPAARISYTPTVDALSASTKIAGQGQGRKIGALVLGGAAIFMFAGGVPPIIPLISAELRPQRYLQSSGRSSADIFAKIGEYKALVTDFKNLEADYNSARRQQQLDAHLSAFGIRGARIPKLTSGDIASLASYGFTTAFDATMRDVQDAHGIGPVKSASIMAWVKQVEAKFRFSPDYTAADKAALQTKRDNIVSRQQGCADSLTKLVEQLKQQHKQLSDWLAGNDAQLQQIAEEMAQAEADLRHLNIPLPPIQTVPPIYFNTPGPSRTSAYTSTTAGRTSATSGYSARPAGSSIPSCPVCGSSMRLRTARRGKRAGRQFWGCGRYPTCQGTRNV